MLKNIIKNTESVIMVLLTGRVNGEVGSHGHWAGQHPKWGIGAEPMWAKKYIYEYLRARAGYLRYTSNPFWENQC